MKLIAINAFIVLRYDLIQVIRDSYDEERVKLKIPPMGAYLTYVTKMGFVL